MGSMGINENPIPFEEMIFGHGIPDLGPDVDAQEARQAMGVTEEPLPPAGREATRDEVLARVAANLAATLGQALAGALIDLENSRAVQDQAVSDSLREHHERLETNARAVEELRNTCEELRAGRASLEEARGRHESQIGALQGETRELSASITSRLDALCAQLNVQQEGLSGLQSSVSEISPRVHAVVERLDRQAEAIRSVSDASARRQATLHQLAETLNQLKSLALPALPEGL